jgi:hypothetical protein
MFDWLLLMRTAMCGPCCLVVYMSLVLYKAHVLAVVLLRGTVHLSWCCLGLSAPCGSDSGVCNWQSWQMSCIAAAIFLQAHCTLPGSCAIGQGTTDGVDIQRDAHTHHVARALLGLMACHHCYMRQRWTTPQLAHHAALSSQSGATTPTMFSKVNNPDTTATACIQLKPLA